MATSTLTETDNLTKNYSVHVEIITEKQEAAGWKLCHAQLQYMISESTKFLTQ